MGSKDQRRVLGPERTTPYSFLQKPTKSEISFDGRSSHSTRKIFMALGAISQAEGSAFVEVGDTKVICGVYGPREIQRASDFKLTAQVSCEVSFAPFAYKVRKPPQPDRVQREMSRQLKEALEAVIILEKFPKAQIDVFISVVEDGGSLFSTCLTAAGLALSHSSIDLYDLIVGVDLIWNEGISYLSPTLQEEEFIGNERRRGITGSGSLTLGMMPKYAKGQVALMLQEGELDPETLSEGIIKATEACHSLYKLVRQVLLSQAEKISAETQSQQSTETT